MTGLIDKEMTIYEIVSIYPNLLDVFTANGFPHFSEKSTLEAAGRFLKLSTALKTKGYDVDTYIKLLVEKIRSDENFKTFTKNKEFSDLKVVGLLPCPVRVPLQEQFASFLESFEAKHKVK